MNGENRVPGVERAIALVHFLAEKPEGATQLQLQKALGISMSSTYRILRTLLSQHWVRKSEDGVYWLGSGLLPVLTRLHGGPKMLDDLQWIIDRVAKEHGVTCKVSVRRGDEQVTLLRAEADSRLVLTGHPGARFPVVEGSVGAALLYQESEARLREMLESCREEIPERRDPQLLLKNVAAVRQNGYAENRNSRWKILALSAPLHHVDGSVLGVLTFVLPEMSSGARGQLDHLLKATAAECEQCMHRKGD